MEIAVWVIQPRIAHGDRRSDIGGTDDDLIAIDLCDSGFPLVVGTGDLEALHCSAVPGLQSTVGMLEGDCHRVTADGGIGGKRAANGGNFLAVNRAERPERETATDFLFVLRMDVLGVTDVDGNGYAGLRYLQRL